jgi:hypothetical protein
MWSPAAAAMVAMEVWAVALTVRRRTGQEVALAAMHSVQLQLALQLLVLLLPLAQLVLLQQMARLAPALLVPRTLKAAGAARVTAAGMGTLASGLSCMSPACRLHVACMSPACCLHVACMSPACRLHVACTWMDVCVLAMM